MCNVEKPYSNFGKSKYSDGYRARCNECRNTYETPMNQKNNAEKIKAYREKNKEKFNEASKNYYHSNPEYFEKYRSENKDHYKKWRQDNKDLVNEYRKNKLKSDINFKIKAYLRTRLSTLIKRNKTNKVDSTLKLLGCSLKDFKTYLQSKFTLGMSWENYGKFGWHIDHIKPCASFDLTKEEDQRKCFHYTNLQPLWAKDNLKKGASH